MSCDAGIEMHHREAAIHFPYGKREVRRKRDYGEVAQTYSALEWEKYFREALLVRGCRLPWPGSSATWRTGGRPLPQWEGVLSALHLTLFGDCL